jgi:putative flavoprotein involved in K+ transport
MRRLWPASRRPTASAGPQVDNEGAGGFGGTGVARVDSRTLRGVLTRFRCSSGVAKLLRVTGARARKTNTIIIGAGQAGLTLSRELSRRSVAHAVLERGRIGERWRSERWESLTLLTPNWLNRLSGGEAHADAEGFLHRRDFVDYLQNYAASAGTRVRESVEVLAVERHREGFHVRTDSGNWRTRNVVVATGDTDVISRPPQAMAAPPWLVQLDANRYRSAGQLSAGGVLVVGAGASGQQIASELRHAGQRVVIATGTHARMVRRYQGKDIWYWLDRLGDLEQTIDEVPDADAARRAVSLGLSGRNGGEEIGLNRLSALGVTIAGRLESWDGTAARFSDNLEVDVADSELRMHRLLDRVDAYLDTHSDAELAGPGREAIAPVALPAPPSSLDLVSERIATVIWATGYRRTYPWLHLPVVDRAGEIQHRYGVTAVPGLYVLGLRFQRRRASHFIGGVGADAAFLAEHLTACGQHRPSTASRPCPVAPRVAPKAFAAYA